MTGDLRSHPQRGLIGDDVSSMIPGSFGVAGINFAPMYNFNNYFGQGFLRMRNMMRVPILKSIEWASITRAI